MYCTYSTVLNRFSVALFLFASLPLTNENMGRWVSERERRKVDGWDRERKWMGETERKWITIEGKIKIVFYLQSLYTSIKRNQDDL